MPHRILLSLIVTLCLAYSASAEQLKQFDVIIAGGSTAAFAAAVSAAQQGVEVALIEPTDWVGGQITSSGVPAIDEAWHKLSTNGEVTMDVAKIARTPANISPLLRNMLDDTGCPGNCWVSRFCFAPKPFLDKHLTPLHQQFENLTVFHNTVIKDVRTSNDRVASIVAIRRTPKTRDYVSLPSEALPDWYSHRPSHRFDKQKLEFIAKPHGVFIDATEWGELLALSDAPYLIGVEHNDGDLEGNERIGQSITYGFVQILHETADPTRDAAVPNPKCAELGFGDYEGKERAWELIWTYRRIVSPNKQRVAVGDASLQNWGYYPKRNEGGNDYPFGYLFLDKTQTRAQKHNWIGGVDLDVMAKAEQRAFAWHHYFKSRAPKEINADRISLDTAQLGTAHGLSKLPYIRDTRRSIGLDNFLLKVADLAPTSPGKLAKRFDDRIALGAYPIDIHPLANTNYPDYIDATYETAPFTIPFRSLTNKQYSNLLVVGKTMAQSFLANSATRLHPTEWSTGTAAGVAAAFMNQKRQTSRDALAAIEELQAVVKKYTPIDWTLKSQPRGPSQ